MTFKKYHFGPPKKCVFCFWRKPPKKNFSLCFGFDSALNTIDAQMFFWLVFFKTHKKIVIDHQKHHFGSFWRLITFFLCVLNNIDQDNICVSIVLKAKTEKKYAKKGIDLPKKGIFEFWNKNLKKYRSKEHLCVYCF